jgi:hypothetical protein
MGVSTPFTTVALTSAQRAAGTFGSGSLINAGEADYVLFFVDVSAAEGDTHTLDVVLQTAPADASTWTSVTRSAITQITTTTGYAYGFSATADLHVQVLATVGGTNTPKVTFSVVAVIF